MMESNRRGMADGINGGLFLIGLGVLMLTGWWWPGIMFVIGISAAAGQVFRGKYMSALITLAIFFSIPLLLFANIPWHIFGPMVMIGIGAILLVKAFILRDM